MPEAPVYISRQSSQGIGELQPTRASMGEMTGQATARFGQALSGMGTQVFALSEKIEKINIDTRQNSQLTTALEEAERERIALENDPDPATAEQRYREKFTKITEAAIDGLPAEHAAQQRLRLARLGIDQVNKVRGRALSQQADTVSADIDRQYALLSRRYADAGSDAERATITGELDATLSANVQRGLITAKGAEAYRNSLAKTGDTALIYRQIGQNPAAAAAALADPARFAGLDPVQREQLRTHAREAAQQQQLQRLEIRARTDPEAAAMEAGRVTNTAALARIFDRAIVPQESSGNTNAQSVQGAAGIGQIMPQTARGLAKAMGLDGDWQSLSDADIQKRLKENPGINRAMGIRLLQDNAKRYDGSMPAIIAAYHSSPGPIDAAHKAAIAKYGEGYSAAQFIEMLPDTLKDGTNKKTKDYVRDIYRRMGVDVAAPGFSGMGTFRASDIVQRELDRREALTTQSVNEMTRLAADQAGKYGGLLDQGMNVNPAQLSAIKAPLELGAARGDAKSAEALRVLNERIEMLPQVQRAYRMQPAEIEAEVAGLRQQFQRDPTPEKQRVLQVFENVAKEVARGTKEAQIDLAERQQIVPRTAINPQADIRGEDFAAMIRDRSLASDRAVKAYRGTQQFFKAAEGLAFKERFEAAGENDRFEMLRAIKRGSTSEGAFRAAVSEMTGGDKLSATAGMFMLTNEGLARDILRGAAIAQLDGIKPKAEEVKTALKSAMPGLVYPPAIQGQLIDAALAVYAAERGKNATLYDAADRSGLERAIERVTGRMVTINGTKVPAPRSLSAAQFEGIMGRGGVLTEEGLASQGGAKSANGDKLDASFIRRNATLVPADDRIGDHQRYRVVLMQGGTEKGVMRADGQGYLYFNMAELFAKERLLTGNSTANPTEMFTRDRRTGVLIYPSTDKAPAR